MSDSVFIDEVVGWRAWGVKRHEARIPVLYSLIHEEPWPTGQWKIAECEDNHRPPGEDCTCGIYAARDRSHLDLLRYASSYYLRVVGEVGLAGRVVVGDKGWRAERARVIRLLVPYEHWQLVAPLRRAYNVPVELAYTLPPEEVLA